MPDLARIHWDYLLARFDAGTLERAEVVRALNTGAPVPVEANRMMAAVVSGYKFKRGRKELPSDRKRFINAIYQHILPMVSGGQLDPELDPEARQVLQAAHKKAEDSGEPYVVARDLVANMFGITRNQVKDSVTFSNKKADSAPT